MESWNIHTILELQKLSDPHHNCMLDLHVERRLVDSPSVAQSIVYETVLYTG